MKNTGMPISLDPAWLCEYLELEPDLYEFMQPISVPSLAAWSFDKRRIEGWAAYLWHDFSLPSFDLAARYLLLMDTAPSPACIYVNEIYAGDYHAPGDDDPPFELDITSFLRPGTNRISFRIQGSAQGKFDGVVLLPVVQR
jgi:hypothetical protein